MILGAGRAFCEAAWSMSAAFVATVRAAKAGKL